MPFVIKNLMDMSKEEDPKALIKAFRDGFGVTLTTNGDAIAPSMDEMTTFIAAAVESSREAGVEDEGLDKYYLDRVEEVSDDTNIEHADITEGLDDMSIPKEDPAPTADVKEEPEVKVPDGKADDDGFVVIDAAKGGIGPDEEDALYDLIMSMSEEQRGSFLQKFDPDIRLPEVTTEEPEQQLGAVDILQQQKPKSGNNLAKLIGNLKF